MKLKLALVVFLIIAALVVSGCCCCAVPCKRSYTILHYGEFGWPIKTSDGTPAATVLPTTLPT